MPMLSKSELIKKLGDPFTYRKRVAEVMQYKDAHYVDKYLRGLPRVGTRYFSIDVADRILASVKYERSDYE